MSERETTFSEEKQLLPNASLATILLGSFKIFPKNGQTFLFIYTLFILPISVLNFVVSQIATPWENEIYNLEFLTAGTHTLFEARQVWQETRQSAVSLFFLKSRFVIPSFILSLTATITATNAAFLSYHGRGTTLFVALSSVKAAWKRVLATSVVVYVLLLLYNLVNYYLAVLFYWTQFMTLLVKTIGLGFEVFLMTIMGFGLVVSVLEDHYGWGAIWVGYELIKGRRFCGWTLTAICFLVSASIGYLMEGTMKNKDVLGSSMWMSLIGMSHKAGLVVVHGAELLWGYAATTVFYCECKKRHGIRGEDDGIPLVHI